MFWAFSAGFLLGVLICVIAALLMYLAAVTEDD